MLKPWLLLDGWMAEPMSFDVLPIVHYWCELP
jgi:hypothetical protein